MSAISSQTRAKIKGYLEGFIQGLVDEYKGRKIQKPHNAREYLSRTSSNGELKPFQAAIVPPEIIHLNQFERGLSTRLGNSLEECARLIALEHHQKAHRSYDLTAEVCLEAFAEIERQKERYESSVNRQQSLSFNRMVDEILKKRCNAIIGTKTVRADLYIVARDGTEIFFEIKAPKPNKGQCLEVIQRLLRFHLLKGRNRPKIQAYYAMPYNPYGAKKADYKWSQARNYLPFEEVVTIGQEFWTMVGGTTAYEELLEIYLEVGQEKSKFILDTLALGF